MQILYGENNLGKLARPPSAQDKLEFMWNWIKSFLFKDCVLSMAVDRLASSLEICKDFCPLKSLNWNSIYWLWYIGEDW